MKPELANLSFRLLLTDSLPHGIPVNSIVTRRTPRLIITTGQGPITIEIITPDPILVTGNPDPEAFSEKGASEEAGEEPHRTEDQIFRTRLSTDTRAPPDTTTTNPTTPHIGMTEEVILDQGMQRNIITPSRFPRIL